MAEITTKPPPAAKAAVTRERAMPVIRLTRVVDKTTALSDEVLLSVDKGHRAAIEAVGRFVITVEDALPQEVVSTADVAKKITESGIEMADRLVGTGYEVLRNVIDSTGKSLGSRN